MTAGTANKCTARLIVKRCDVSCITCILVFLYVSCVAGRPKQCQCWFHHLQVLVFPLFGRGYPPCQQTAASLQQICVTVRTIAYKYAPPPSPTPFPPPGTPFCPQKYQAYKLGLHTGMHAMVASLVLARTHTSHAHSDFLCTLQVCDACKLEHTNAL